MSASTIYDGLDERERLFNAFLAQDRKTWIDFKALVSEKSDRIKTLEEHKQYLELERRVNQRHLDESNKLVECLRNVLKNIVSDFPKSEWKDRMTYRIACEYANGKEVNHP